MSKNALNEKFSTKHPDDESSSLRKSLGKKGDAKFAPWNYSDIASIGLFVVAIFITWTVGIFLEITK